MAAQADACEQQPPAVEGALQESAARHDRNLETLSDPIQQLTQAGQVSFATAFSNPPVCAVSCPEPHLSTPERFARGPRQTILLSFTDLMKRMLQLDSNQPITPHALLEHPFISLERGVQHNSSYPEPSHSSCYPEPSVDHYNSCCPESSVDTSCPEPNVDHHSSSSCLEKEMMVL
ncbi:unnamed protein product [Merluccius merluccius]